MYDIDYESASQFWIKKDAENIKLPEADLKARIKSVIAKHKTCAFACASGDFVRCTPLEFVYKNNAFYFLSEGGLKFKALKDNKNVALSMHSEFEGFGNLEGLQISGTAEMIEPFCDEYNSILEARKVPVEAMKKLPVAMNLIKVTPVVIDLLDASLKKEGFSTRQQLR